MTVCGLDAAELKIECGSPPMDLGRDAYRSERTERDIHLVGADYYTALGRNAYAQLSNEMRRGGLGDSFVELADRFPDFVRVLGAISALELFKTEQDAIRLYKRWLQTGSAREADLLVRRGLIPVPPPTRRQ